MTWTDFARNQIVAISTNSRESHIGCSSAAWNVKKQGYVRKRGSLHFLHCTRISEPYREASHFAMAFHLFCDQVDSQSLSGTSGDLQALVLVIVGLHNGLHAVDEVLLFA